MSEPAIETISVHHSEKKKKKFKGRVMGDGFDSALVCRLGDSRRGWLANTYVVDLARRSTANGIGNADTVDTDIIHRPVQG